MHADNLKAILRKLLQIRREDNLVMLYPDATQAFIDDDNHHEYDALLNQVAVTTTHLMAVNLWRNHYTVVELEILHNEITNTTRIKRYFIDPKANVPTAGLQRCIMLMTKICTTVWPRCVVEDLNCVIDRRLQLNGVSCGVYAAYWLIERLHRNVAWNDIVRQLTQTIRGDLTRADNFMENSVRPALQALFTPRARELPGAMMEL